MKRHGPEGDTISVTDMQHHDKWVIDSGCSYYRTIRRDCFHIVKELTSGKYFLVMIAREECNGLVQSTKLMEAWSRQS